MSPPWDIYTRGVGRDVFIFITNFLVAGGKAGFYKEHPPPSGLEEEELPPTMRQTLAGILQHVQSPCVHIPHSSLLSDVQGGGPSVPYNPLKRLSCRPHPILPKPPVFLFPHREHLHSTIGLDLCVSFPDNFTFLSLRLSFSMVEPDLTSPSQERGRCPCLRESGAVAGVLCSPWNL